MPQLLPYLKVLVLLLHPPYLPAPTQAQYYQVTLHVAVHSVLFLPQLSLPFHVNLLRRTCHSSSSTLCTDLPAVRTTEAPSHAR